MIVASSVTSLDYSTASALAGKSTTGCLLWCNRLDKSQCYSTMTECTWTKSSSTKHQPTGCCNWKKVPLAQRTGNRVIFSHSILYHFYSAKKFTLMWLTSATINCQERQKLFKWFSGTSWPQTPTHTLKKKVKLGSYYIYKSFYGEHNKVCMSCMKFNNFTLVKFIFVEMTSPNQARVVSCLDKITRDFKPQENHWGL